MKKTDYSGSLFPMLSESDYQLIAPQVTRKSSAVASAVESAVEHVEGIAQAQVCHAGARLGDKIGAVYLIGFFAYLLLRML